MLSLYSTFILLFYSAFVDAGSANHGDPCSQGNNRLQAGTFQFFSDCNSVTFCADNSTCLPKGCRKDDFPFGYAQDSHLIPPQCDTSVQFCPDEADACHDLIPVGQKCQLNRDDQCIAPPNFQELADDSNKGRNFNGSVCLNNICYWANVTENDACVVENMAYIGYGKDGEFIDIVSRGNCKIGLYCDAQSLSCKTNKLLGDTCDADKECDSWNCSNAGVCGPAADEPRQVDAWVYAVVSIAVIGGMLATLIGLYILHRRHRDREGAKRDQYWKEQRAYHRSLLQLRETARGSQLGHHSNLSDAGSDESHAPILQHAAPKASGLRYEADDASFDEGYLMAHNQIVMRADGKF
ncbi:hypothetical protein C8J56DRAFT_922871 [Mycena floridula]|nr:hypothetical protein C8J56DRAFT_922871 [Mycena floridula]